MNAANPAEVRSSGNYNYRIAGIELHILPEHSSLLGLTQVIALDYAEQTPFLRIWFQHERKGVCDGLEAFGDAHFLATNEDEWLILVGTKHWISSEDAEWLKTLATRTE